MTDFGDKMKEYENDLTNNEIISMKEARKRSHKERIYKYPAEVSGIDMFVTRVVNDKPTSKLVLMLSRKDEAGKPICFIKQKDGTNVAVSESSLKSFLDGLAVTNQFPNKSVQTGCIAIPRLIRDKTFLSYLPAYLDNPLLIDLTRQGLVTFDLVYKAASEDGWRCSVQTPWFCTNYDRYDSSFNSTFRKENKEMYDPNTGTTTTVIRYPRFNEKNIHTKLVKEILKYAVEVYGDSEADAIESLYTGNRPDKRKVKAVTCNVVKAFVTIANKYDEVFAIKCFHEYMDDCNLGGISAVRLDMLFRIDMTSNKMYKNTNPYRSNLNVDYVPGSYIHDTVGEVSDSKIIQFDKNKFWEYILQSTCVGKGKDLDSYINLWNDYLSMCLSIEGKINDKYPEAIQVAHDIYANEFTEIQRFAEDDKLEEVTEPASKYCDHKIQDGWQFKVFRTQKEFVDEAKQNSNCVASYVDRVINGHCWIASMRPIGSDTTVLTVEIQPSTGRFVQIKGKFNRNATKKELAILKKFQDHTFKKMIEAGVLAKDEVRLPTCFQDIRNETLDVEE